jgi:hypothetical protein
MTSLQALLFFRIKLFFQGQKRPDVSFACVEKPGLVGFKKFAFSWG